MPTPTQIVNYLINNQYTNSSSTITARDLATHFGISDGGVEVEMRSDIRAAIALGELIGSNNRGYYMVTSLSEIEDNLNSLQSRAEETLTRRRNLLNKWNSNNSTNQTTLTDLNVQ